MTRRGFLGLLAGAQGAQQAGGSAGFPETANEFHRAYVIWANAFNKCSSQTFYAPVVTAWEPLPELWRKVERGWRKWLTCLK